LLELTGFLQFKLISRSDHREKKIFSASTKKFVTDAEQDGTNDLIRRCLHHPGSAFH